MTKPEQRRHQGLREFVALFPYLTPLFTALRSIATLRREQDAEKWPGVQQAFEIAKESYATLCQRLDAADARIQGVQAYSASVTLAVPVIVGAINEKATYASYWFYLAMCLFAMIVIIGAVGLAFGTVQMMSPRVLYKKWLHYGDWEFKKNFVYWAGIHFEQNRALVNTKGRLATVLTILFLTESAALLVWASHQL